MRTALLVALCVSATLASTVASADDKAACLAATQQAQSLRDAHKLVEAREQLRICARQQCPAVVQKDCLTWLGEVEKSLPTVVATAKDEAGSDLGDVKVTLDRAPPVTTGTAPVTPPPPPSATSPAQPPPAPTPATTAGAPSGGSRPWKTVGWILGGVGVVGLGVGAAFGLMAMSDRNNANCGTGDNATWGSNYCDAGPISSAKSAAGVANIGFIGGGVLIAGGLVLVLTAPGSHEGAATLKLAPMVGTGHGGLAVGGGW